VAFASHSSPTQVLYKYAQLLNPSTSCANNDFIAAQGMALFLELVHSANPSTLGQFQLKIQPEMVQAFGHSNLRHHGLRTPSQHEIEKDVTNGLQGRGTSMFSMLSLYDVRIVSTITMWVSTQIFGLGLEIITFLFIIPSLSETAVEALSIIAEIFFPIALSVAIYEGTPFGLLVLVIGLWKLGLPETYVHFERGLNQPMGGCKGLANSLGNFLVGTATFLHHSSIAWCTCSLCSGLITLNRYHVAIMVPLIVMHWCNLFRYIDFKLYIGCMLIMEVFWELEMNQFIRYHVGDTHELMAASMLLFSHWYSWVGGSIMLFSSDKDSVRSLAATVANISLEDLEQNKTREGEDTKSNYFLSYLKEVSLFAGLSIPDIRLIATAMKPRHFEHQELVIKQGDQADTMFVLYKGTAVVEKDGIPLFRVRYTSGDYFGELALLDTNADRRAASVRAQGKVTCFSLDKNAFNELVLPHEHLKARMKEQQRKYGKKKQAATRARANSVPDAKLRGSASFGSTIQITRPLVFDTVLEEEELT